MSEWLELDRTVAEHEDLVLRLLSRIEELAGETARTVKAEGPRALPKLRAANDLLRRMLSLCSEWEKLL